PGIQAPPPPVRQESPPQVCLASSVPATVKNSHFFWPVLASTPNSGPREVHSPPWLPMMMVSLTTSGAPVKPTVSFSELTSLVSQAFLPVFMSSAIRWPSTVPTYTLPCPSATPRLYGECVCIETRSSLSSGKNDQMSLPVAPSSANTRLYEPE